MQRSTERILTTHVGSLVRPPEIMALMEAKTKGQPAPQAQFDATVSKAVAEVVQKQAEVGIDVVSDGEYAKIRPLYTSDASDD